MSYTDQLQSARKLVQLNAERHKLTQVAADKALAEYQAALLALTELVTLGTVDMRPEFPAKT
ncbi:MAG TPA: hypothetical protein VH107_15415 [Lacipirellulaceae bacterium]|jgi:hypothetical protein|nr:hypothetical protein [Lacipirellulaceae bacterium]